MHSVKDNNNRFKNWLYEAFSEKGVGSAKRLVGAFISFISMGCIVYLTITAGPVAIVQDLLQTALITGAALLGLHSITSIWKNGSMSVGGNGKNIKYSGDNSQQVLEDVLDRNDVQTIDDIMDGGAIKNDPDDTRKNN